MFSRRVKKSIRKKLRDFFWPSIGWKKTGTYYKCRIVRLKGTPRSIALGVAIGVGISFTPIIGLHILSATLLCLVFRANLISCMLGTLIANPATLPLIWLGTYIMGCTLLGITPDTEMFHDVFSKHVIKTHFYEIFMPMVAAGSICGILSGLLVYYPVKKLVVAFQTKKAPTKRRAEKT